MTRMENRGTSRRSGMSAIGAVVEKVAAPAFEKHGRGYGQIVLGWTEYAGDALAAVSRPASLSRAAKSGRRSGGCTLTVDVCGAYALDLQYAAPRVMARINTAFGFQMVARLCIVQGPPSLAVRPEPPRTPVEPEDPDQFASIENPDLRLSLARLRAATERDR